MEREQPSLAPLFASRRVVLGPADVLAPSRQARRQLAKQFVAEYCVQRRLARRRLVQRRGLLLF